jgi:vitamin B12 transporter
MKRTVSFLIPIFLSGALWAVDGTVVDASGRSIQGARIECGGRVTASGVDGRFALPDVASCEAAVSFPGFETRRVALAAAAVTVELPLAALTELVVVTATRHEAKAEEAGVAASVVTAAELAQQQYPPLGDIMRQAAGFEVARSGRPGSLTELFARGGQRTSTLLLIDGVPANDPGGELNLAGFTTGSVDRIEMVRGPESALFGAEAASGVVQIFTRQGDPEDRVPHGSLSYERGSFQTDRWAANLTGGSGARLDYALGAEQFHTVGAYQNDYFRNTTGTANLGYRFSDATRLRGVYRSFDSMLGVPNEVGFGIYDLYGSEATRDSLVSLRLDDVRSASFAQRFSFGYHRNHDLFLDPEMNGPYNVAALVRDVTAPVPRVYLVGLADPASTPPPGTRLVRQTAYIGPYDPYLTLSSRKDFEYQGTLTQRRGASAFGYEYQLQDADVGGRDVGRDNQAIYWHQQQAIGSRLYLSAGVRLERNSAFGTKFTPRGAASYRLTSSTFLRFSAGIGFTEPSLLQNFAKDAYSVGNPALSPEKTVSYEAGLSQDWFGRRLHTEVSGFANSFRDLITYFANPWPQPSTWKNIAASRARGIEIAAEFRPMRVLRISGSYMYMKTRITISDSPGSLFSGVGQELPKRPGNSGSVWVSLAPRRWSLQAGSVFVGERQDTDYYFGVTRNPGYQNVFASGSFRINRHFSPYLRVDNLLNKRYQEVLGYPALTRNVRGGLRLEW